MSKRLFKCARPKNLQASLIVCPDPIKTTEHARRENSKTDHARRERIVIVGILLLASTSRRDSAKKVQYALFIIQEALLPLRIFWLQVPKEPKKKGQEKRKGQESSRILQNSEYRDQHPSQRAIQTCFKNARSPCAPKFDDVDSDHTACLEECCR